MVGYVPKRFTCHQTVTHPSSNRRARCRATTLIETNVLTTTQYTMQPLRFLIVCHPYTTVSK